MFPAIVAAGGHYLVAILANWRRFYSTHSQWCIPALFGDCRFTRLFVSLLVILWVKELKYMQLGDN
jgi:hypothetical protein